MMKNQMIIGKTMLETKSIKTTKYNRFIFLRSFVFFNIQKKIFNKIHPNITFLIDLDIKESKSRIKKRPKKTNRFDKLSNYHFNKIRNGFLKISKIYKNKIFLINGRNSLDEVKNEINKKTLKLLNAKH